MPAVASLALLLGMAAPCPALQSTDIVAAFQRKDANPGDFLDGKVREYKIPLAAAKDQDTFLVYVSGVEPGVLLYALQGPCDGRLCLTIVGERLDGPVNEPDFIYKFSIPNNLFGKALAYFPLMRLHHRLENRASHFLEENPRINGLPLDIMLEELDKPRHGMLVRREDATLTPEYARAFDDAVCSVLQTK